MMNHSNLESDVWDLFRQGSSDAFSKLYHQHFNGLYQYAQRMLGSADEAKDSVQDLFAILWEQRQQLPLVHSVKPYLFRALRNRLINQLQRQDRQKQHLYQLYTEQAAFQFAAQDFSPHQSITPEEVAIQILNQLPPRRREAIYLRYFRKLSYQEIALIMNLSQRAVINHNYKAFKALRKDENVQRLIRHIAVFLLTLLTIA